MPTTSNFGWTTPADTDLVKDGAAAIRTLGNGIDTSLVDLKGGTTGQVLSKASNTDLDFTWIAVDPLTILDAKGDLISATAADTPARLAVGTNGQYLSADSTTSTGLKWVTPAGATKNFTLINTGGTSLSGSSTVTISGISNQDEIFIYIDQASSATFAYTLAVRVNGSSSTIYNYAGPNISVGSGYNASDYSYSQGSSDTSIRIGEWSDNPGSKISGWLRISGAATSGQKIVDFQTGSTRSGGYGNDLVWGGGYINTSSTISSISLVQLESYNFDNGIIYVYASA